MKRRIDWVIVRDSGATALCERCGGKFTLTLPCILSIWCAAMKEFVKVHSKCKIIKPRGKPFSKGEDLRRKDRLKGGAKC